MTGVVGALNHQPNLVRRIEVVIDQHQRPLTIGAMHGLSGDHGAPGGTGIKGPASRISEALRAGRAFCARWWLDYGVRAKGDYSNRIGDHSSATSSGQHS